MLNVIQKLCSYIQVYKAIIYKYTCILHVTFYNTSSQLRYWFDGDDIRTASDVRVGKQDQAVIYGIQKNYLYCLRVLGFSTGGDGTMSELVYFTLGEHCLHVLVFCTLIYHKRHLTSNLTKKGDNPLAFSLIHGIQNLWWMQWTVTFILQCNKFMYWWNSSWC